MKISFRRFTTGVLFAAVIAGAGAAQAAGTHGGGGHGFTFGKPAKTTQADRTIRVTALDTEFNIERLHIHAGETIRFIVTNDGELDHDFTIGPAALQAKHRNEMMEMMDGGDGMMAMHADPNAVYLKPGETKELVWHFTRSQDLEFACNVPGHYESGMLGEISPTAGHDQAS